VQPEAGREVNHDEHEDYDNDNDPGFTIHVAQKENDFECAAASGYSLEFYGAFGKLGGRDYQYYEIASSSRSIGWLHLAAANFDQGPSASAR
jgi:hypothetical protein